MAVTETSLKITPVILCGGSGSRLWPVSRETYPKPFVRMENGRTLFIDTLERADSVANAANPVIVCNEAHRFYVLESLAQCRMEGRIILEPQGRNTAPAIALAAFCMLQADPDAIMLVMPSDHAIPDAASFCRAVEEASPVAAAGRIVTFGVAPERPECGYGYIQCGQPLADGCFEVKRFVEKPDQAAAVRMVDSGGYYWNSGIFLLAPAVYLEELRKYAPGIYESCLEAWQGREADMGFVRPDAKAFSASPADSIDYAVMEHTGLAAVFPLDVHWSDLGSWQAFYEAETGDENGNVIIGDVLAVDASNCYCHAQDRLLAAVGVKNLAIVETRDAVLVVAREKSQSVKQIVEHLRLARRNEYRDPPVVCRPWGSFESLATGARFQVKKIVVKPGGTLSLQLHHHRAEHWVVVKGTASVTVGEDTRFLTENQSVYIPVGIKHKLANPGIIPLEIIEIQSGSYLGEDDIVRFEDIYGRK